jgi:pimeloyl-ACP methyl ester carboxylesterase
MLFFSSRGYPCYAVSYRGHGGSWYPGFWNMYFTSRESMAKDLVAGIEEAERLEGERRKAEEKVRVVLIAHSAGGALSQWVLSRGLVRVQGFCMFAAVPGFGSWSCYKFWAFSAPLNILYRFFHPRYVLATTKQVHDAFFTPSTPASIVEDLGRLLSPYESMGWPMQALFPFVTGPDVIKSITGWKPRNSTGEDGNGVTIAPRLLVLAAELDVLCTPSVLLDAAKRYRAAFRHCVRAGKLDGILEYDVRATENDDEDWDGITFKVVKGVAHHLQNHIEWERGAEEVWRWTECL